MSVSRMYVLRVTEVLERVMRGTMWRRFRANGTCGKNGGMDGTTAREAVFDGIILVRYFSRRLDGS